MKPFWAMALLVGSIGCGCALTDPETDRQSQKDWPELAPLRRQHSDGDEQPAALTGPGREIEKNLGY